MLKIHSTSRLCRILLWNRNSSWVRKTWITSSLSTSSSSPTDSLPMNTHPHSEVLLTTTFASKDTWKQYLQSIGLKVQVYPDEITDLNKIEFAICWQPPAGLLQRCTNLKAIQSMGAGVDSLFQDPHLPHHIPILRVIDPLMSERMATWCLWCVINIQRKCDDYLKAQARSTWDKSIENYRNIDNNECRVGIMGLGVMGGAVADALLKLNYTVSSWTRTSSKQKVLCTKGDGTCADEGVASSKSKIHNNKNNNEITKFYHGSDQLLDFARNNDIIICLLPLTPSTQGILDKRLFQEMPKNSSIINAARGKHLVEQDVLDALDSGHISCAILDVFDQEPLNEESALWKHPNIRIFPHVSAMTNIETSVAQMMENRRIVLDNAHGGGKELLPNELVVDSKSGY